MKILGIVFLYVNFFSVWFERNSLGKTLNLGLCFCVFMLKFESMYFYVFNLVKLINYYF